MSMFQEQSGGVVPSWSLADRLRKAREYADMEQGDLAPLILKKRSTLSAWENGKHRPDELTLRAIAFHTGVSFEWLAHGIEPQDDGPDGPTEQENRQSGCKLYQLRAA